MATPRRKCCWALGDPDVGNEMLPTFSSCADAGAASNASNATATRRLIDASLNEISRYRCILAKRVFGLAVFVVISAHGPVSSGSLGGVGRRTLPFACGAF